MAAGNRMNDKRSLPQAGAAASTPVADDTAERRDHEQDEPDDAAPTVGKTGGRGARAERPSEGGSDRKASTAPVESTRVAKPPAETPKAAGAGRPGAAGEDQAG